MPFGAIDDITARAEQHPFVRFERVAVEDAAASRREGRYVARDIDYALVTPPYSKDIFKQKAEVWFAQLDRDEKDGRVSRRWIDDSKARYAAFKEGRELPLEGTPIRGWPVISPAMQEILLHHKIMTVEVAAGMNDEALRRVGMGAFDIKNKAIAWLQAAKDKGPLTMEVAQLKQENALLRSNLDSTTETVKALKAQMDTLMTHRPLGASNEAVPGYGPVDAAFQDAPPKRGPGRPKRVETPGPTLTEGLV